MMTAFDSCNLLRRSALGSVSPAFSEQRCNGINVCLLEPSAVEQESVGLQPGGRAVEQPLSGLLAKEFWSQNAGSLELCSTVVQLFVSNGRSIVRLSRQADLVV